MSFVFNCYVCLDNYNESDRKPYVLVPCGHGFCKHCVSKLPEKLCPLCKCYINETITNWPMIDVILTPK